MSTHERQKFTFDHDQARARALRLAISCREAARLHPEYRGHLRTKMRHHALALRPLTRRHRLNFLP